MTLGGRDVLLYPLYHPAAALYTPAMLKVLETDFARLPQLLGRTAEKGGARTGARSRRSWRPSRPSSSASSDSRPTRCCSAAQRRCRAKRARSSQRGVSKRPLRRSAG